MELRGWQQCQRNPSPCTGTVSLLPPSWDTISSIYNQVVKLVSKFPYQKRLVLYFACRGTTVKLDLGDVKAAGVVCFLGLGVGLGTLVIYRLYNRYIRPLLDNQWFSSDQLSCSDCSVLQDSSDSDVDGDGLTCGKPERQGPPVLSYTSYGVAFGGKRSQHQCGQITVDSVRVRRAGTRQKPRQRVHCVDRDSKSDGSSCLNAPLCEVNFMDSFYSTAESGFETLPECNEEEEEEEEGDERGVLGFPLRVIRSALAMKGKRDRHHSSSSGDRTISSPSGNRTVMEMCIENIEQSLQSPLPTSHPELNSVHSSPAHKACPLSDTHIFCQRKCHSYPHSVDDDYEPSLDGSESIHSFNSSEEDWSLEVNEKQGSPHLPNTAMTDRQFRQSVMERIREWSSFAEEHRNTRSPTPECGSPVQLQRTRRSRSLDLNEPAFMPEVDMSPSEPIPVEDCTIKNLECLQTEFQDIQEEFESITSKLHDLIERSTSDDGSQQQCTSTKSSSSQNRPSHLYHPPHQSKCEAEHAKTPYRHTRTRWESIASRSGSGSHRSSRAGSVDFNWDCGEVGIAREMVDRVAQKTDRESPDMDRVPFVSRPEQECLSDDENGTDIVTNVGEAMSMADYAECEWKGDTPKARIIKQGYLSIPDLFHCQRMRKIRGDNYCALRSTLFQVLVGGYKVTHLWPGPITIIDRIRALHSEVSSGLQHWTFAGRLASEGEDKLSTLTRCVLSLYATIDEVSALKCKEERMSRTLSLLNGSELFDTELMEGLKLMMYLHACDLHREMTGDGNVPTFAFLLFARDTSQNVISFVQNHLNPVGDSAGLDQVEMCLLGHCLGIKLRVARLYCYGQQDFHCVFPEDGPDEWPNVCLLAEDDRHYNVPVA